MNKFDLLTTNSLDLLALIIEGERLKLVPIERKFERDIFREFTNEITRYMFPSPANNIEEIQNFISESRRDMQIGNNLQFAILSKTPEEFLGCCGLHGQGKVRTPELGIWIKKSAHGYGYGREAIEILVDWTWHNIDLDYLVYPVDLQNCASRKIPKSLGGIVMNQLKVTTPTGKILDELVYKIDRVSKIG